jgi:hypothetical protein
MATGNVTKHQNEVLYCESMNVDGTAITAAELQLLDGILATTAEINRAADVSTRIVNVTASPLVLAEATHEGKIVTLNLGTGIAVTLPAATGSGAVYTFIIGTVLAGGASHVFSKTGNDTICGTIFGKDGDGDPGNAWTAGATDNTISLGGASLATGGSKGDKLVLVDMAADTWNAVGWITQGGTEATPFSTV